MTKFRLVEREGKIDFETKEYKIQERIIWEGEALELHLGIYHNNIKQPNYISLVDGVIEVAYRLYSNVRVRLESEGKVFAAAFCEPAITPEKYDEIVKANLEHATKMSPKITEMVEAGLARTKGKEEGSPTS